MTYDICIKIIMAPILRKKKRKILALLRGCSCFYFILLVLILGILSMNISSAAYAFQPSNLSPINESKRQLSIRRIPFKSLFVHPSGRTLIRLFDSERSEAGLQLAHNMGGGVTGNPSLMDGITVESFKVKDATFEINTLEHMSDVPTRTKNGGYTHTRASRAKISAANKGKTPWNKGKARSKETCARIAAGVRAKNRERFLQKLKDLNMTEEEYEEQKKAERNKKQAETRARKTEKGGYRPTKETRKKISNILKKKWANGELKKKRIDKTKARRGFTHSEETRKKISDSLRKRWSEDRSYREEMTEKTTIANTSEVTRRRISETLKAKWQDPEFRSMMMEKMKTRKPPSGNSRGKSYREKISEAMKAKWQEKEYRERTVSSIRRNALEAAKRRRIKTKTSLTKQAVSQKKGAKSPTLVEPRIPTKDRKVFKGKKKIINNDTALIKAKPMKKKKPSIKGLPRKKRTVRKGKKEPDGSISRLRDESRDLYNLLYGDEDISNSDENVKFKGIAARFDFEDDNLDNFDPYGLDDY